MPALAGRLQCETMLPMLAHTLPTASTRGPAPSRSLSWWARSCACALLLTSSVPAASAAQSSSGATEKPGRPLTTKEIIARVSPSLVTVETVDSDGVPLAQGSGFFLGSTNRVVTNLHVLKMASKVWVKPLGRGERQPVTKVFGIDWINDLCMLELKGAGVPGLVMSKQAPEVGDDIVAAGTPKGLEGTFSKGIVSALRSGKGLVQIDASISPGSSGGPVVNGRGEVIGVAVSSLVGGQSLNFAVSVDLLLQGAPFRGDVLTAATLALTDSTNGTCAGRFAAW
jgi:S1-C subfamily serine protease